MRLLLFGAGLLGASVLAQEPPPAAPAASTEERIVHFGRFEVTNEQFASFVAATGYLTDAEREGACHGFRKDGSRGEVKGLTWRGFAGAGRGHHPVVCVSFNDAVAYAEWLSQMTGERYRLPTAHEWAAAYCPEKTRYPWGDLWDRSKANSASFWADRDLDARSWQDWFFNGPAAELARKHDGALTTVVGAFPPDARGLYDMAGNVREWTLAEEKEADPSSRPDHSGTGLGAREAEEKAAPKKQYFLSGGSWHNNLELLRCGARDAAPGGGYRDDGVGFRIVRVEK